MGIRPPFIEFVALGDENPALLKCLHGGQNNIALIRVNELQADRFRPGPHGFPQASGLETADHGSGITIQRQCPGQKLHCAVVAGDQNDPLAIL